MTNDLKNKLGETTEQLEQKVKEFAPYYTNLEPWQRGLILIALVAFLIFSVYQLTKSDSRLSSKKESQKEKEAEERLLRQMAFFKRLKE